MGRHPSHHHINHRQRQYVADAGKNARIAMLPTLNGKVDYCGHCARLKIELLNDPAILLLGAAQRK